MFVATHNPLGLIVGSGVKIHEERSGSGKVTGRAKQTADEIADVLKKRFQEEGWIKSRGKALSSRGASVLMMAEVVDFDEGREPGPPASRQPRTAGRSCSSGCAPLTERQPAGAEDDGGGARLGRGRCGCIAPPE